MIKESCMSGILMELSLSKYDNAWRIYGISVKEPGCSIFEKIF